MALLQLEDLHACYRTEVYGISRSVRAVDGVSLELYENEIYGIAGESSSGKTTLIKVLSGTLKPPLRVESGRVHYNFGSFAVDMLSIDPEELRQNVRWKQISYVMQGSMSVLNPVRKIMRTFEEIVRTHQGIPDKKSFVEQTRQHVQRLGLPPDVLDLYPHQLSGGMRQRVAIALATVFHPSLIIADEPVSMVDASLRMAIVNLFKKLRDEQNVSVIYITHDLATAYYISDRIAIMLRGYVVESGPVEQVLDKPLHPYTQLLQESVPRPAVSERTQWARPIELGSTEVKEYSRVGCKYAGRCPHVMDVCKQADPPDVVVEGRTVKCYLYTNDAR